MSKNTCKACNADTPRFGYCASHEIKVRADAPDIVRLVAAMNPRSMALLGKEAVACTAEDLEEMNVRMHDEVVRQLVELSIEDDDYDVLDSVW